MAQKLWEAVAALATGAGPIQDRIRLAVGPVSSLGKDNVPPHLAERVRALAVQLFPLATSRAASAEEASRLASEVVALFLEVAAAFQPPLQTSKA